MLSHILEKPVPSVLNGESPLEMMCKYRHIEIFSFKRAVIKIKLLKRNSFGCTVYSVGLTPHMYQVVFRTKKMVYSIVQCKAF